MQASTENVDSYLEKLQSWKKLNLQLFRESVHKVVPNIEEEIKWGVPVFLINNKMIFAMSSFKEHTKYNFIMNGALLKDSDSLFNNGLESKKSRGIDLREKEKIDIKELENLIEQSVNIFKNSK